MAVASVGANDPRLIPGSPSCSCSRGSRVGVASVAPVQVAPARGRCIAHERRMSLTLSRACPCLGRMSCWRGRRAIAGNRKKDRGREEEEAEPEGSPAKSPDGRPFPSPKLGGSDAPQRLGRSVLRGRLASGRVGRLSDPPRVAADELRILRRDSGCTQYTF
jgi:hypothetical protein